MLTESLLAMVIFKEIPETGYFTKKIVFFCSLSWRFRLMLDSGRDVMVGGTVMV